MSDHGRAWEQSAKGYMLRLNRRRWEDIEVDSLRRPVAIVAGSWLVLAWARFGTQAYTDVRALSRFILVGVWGWLGLSLVLWFLAWRRDGRERTEPVSGDSFARLMAKVGQAHLPLVIGGFVVQLLQILPVGAFITTFAWVMVAWMGGQLVAAVAAFERRSLGHVVGSTLLAWAAWLATAGWYLLNRLGHLI